MNFHSSESIAEYFPFFAIELNNSEKIEKGKV